MFCKIKRFQNGHLEFNLGLIRSCIYEQAPHNEQAWRVGKLSSLLTMALDGNELSGTPQCQYTGEKITLYPWVNLWAGLDALYGGPGLISSGVRFPDTH